MLKHPAAAVGLSFLLVATVLLLLSVSRVPLAISETVAVFENLETESWSVLLRGNEEYVRPLFWGTVGAVWYLAPSLDVAVIVYRALHVACLSWLLISFVRALSPRDAAGWLAMPIALTALLGTSSFRENLEAFPVNPTLFLMACALTAYSLLERPAARANDIAAVVLSILAVTAKEQGLAVPFLIAAGVFTGARGVSRKTALLLLILATSYGAFRFWLLPDTVALTRPLGLGFREWSVDELASFNDQRPLIYLYNVGATALHVVFGEPSRGVFVVTRTLLEGEVQPWHVIYAVSGLAAALLVGVWICVILRRAEAHDDRRLLIIFGATLAVTCALAFSYTRDRMAAVAVAFFAILLYRACRAAIASLESAPRWRAALTLAVMLALASAWQLRAASTVFFVHDAAWESRKEWLVDYLDRQQTFADRPTYLRLMNELRSQGADASIPACELRRPVLQWVDYRW